MTLLNMVFITITFSGKITSAVMNQSDIYKSLAEHQKLMLIQLIFFLLETRKQKLTIYHSQYLHPYQAESQSPLEHQHLLCLYYK